MRNAMRKLALLKKYRRFSQKVSLLLLVGMFFSVGCVSVFSDLSPGENVIVEIPDGAGSAKIAEILKAQGVISSTKIFKVYLRITRQHQKLKAGEYLFEGPKTDMQIVSMLVQGLVYRRKITIPEGWTAQQIAAALAQNYMTDPKAFLATVYDKASIQALLLPNLALDKSTIISAEGFLFPSTYFFAKNTKAKIVIQEMINNFNQSFSPTWPDQMAKMGLTLNQLVTLASIVEKETGADFERPRIASVYHNRLKIGMRLQSDPTTIYGIPNFNGNLTKKDLQTYTPYNTYVIKGLPPGPIANPGRAALEATLNPETTGYLYFVSRNDGTHVFSENYAGHNRAVDEHQRRRRKK